MGWKDIVGLGGMVIMLFFAIGFGYYFYKNTEYVKIDPCTICEQKYNASCFSSFGTAIENGSYIVPGFQLGIGNNYLENISYNGS